MSYPDGGSDVLSELPLSESESELSIYNFCLSRRFCSRFASIDA